MLTVFFFLWQRVEQELKGNGMGNAMVPVSGSSDGNKDSSNCRSMLI